MNARVSTSPDDIILQWYSPNAGLNHLPAPSSMCRVFMGMGVRDMSHIGLNILGHMLSSLSTLVSFCIDYCLQHKEASQLRVRAAQVQWLTRPGGEASWWAGEWPVSEQSWCEFYSACKTNSYIKLRRKESKFTGCCCDPELSVWSLNSEEQEVTQDSRMGSGQVILKADTSRKSLAFYFQKRFQKFGRMRMVMFVSFQHQPLEVFQDKALLQFSSNGAKAITQLLLAI